MGFGVWGLGCRRKPCASVYKIWKRKKIGTVKNLYPLPSAEGNAGPTHNK